ncbi:MAG: FAD-dependent oxidoreductase [Fusobacterium sp.]|uniref:H2O-forming NADH oxidase n=1 Tax=Fusobacterium sp. TaxID=68766 RepID=UPI0026DDC648|nr:FAD-dependent oxidoreductase [Fusobacterium sp.]MDO4689933.1 FAD-dependent oxidoreductase [Fusobacterium sp.]
MKIVVVGANHAGTACINTMLDNYKGNEIVVFDKNSNISFLGCGMALWIGGQISGPEGLFYSSKEKLEAKGAKIHLETEVTEIDFDKKIVYALGKNREKYEETYDKLILSTGSLSIDPSIPGKDLDNVQFVKLYQQAEDVINKLKERPEIKTVAVVGAGYIGVELAEAFKRWGKNVHLIDFCDECLSTYYDKVFRDKMDTQLMNNGVKLNYKQLVKEIKGNKRVEAVVTDKGEYQVDMVVLCIGFKPNSALGRGKINTFRNGAYIVDKTQKTNLDDVYAIGDCATIYDNAIDDVNYIALASNAVRSGIVAAHNVCGRKIESLGVQGSNGISIFGFNMVSTGLTLEKAQRLGIDAMETTFHDLQKPDFMEHNNEQVSIRIVYRKEDRVIIGAQIASKQDISMAIHLFSLAIQEKVTIDKLKLLDIFFLPHFNKPYNYITMAALNAK